MISIEEDWFENVPSLQNIELIENTNPELIGQYTYNYVSDVLAVIVGDGILSRPVENIMEELLLDYGDHPENFSGWYPQGVMVLDINENLDLVLETIDAISNNAKGVGFILYGLNDLIDMIRASRHKTVVVPDFESVKSFGFRPFTQVNTYLKLNGRNQVKWEA